MSAISAWLDGIGLGQYTNTFTENGVDLDLLSDLSESDLEKLGVALGHRKRILRAISDSFVRSQAETSNQVLLPPSQPEKRNLTVLFCDLVGSTALAVQLDPEDLSAVIRRFQAICTEVIRHNGGYVARFMGDGLLVYFGYPQAHEDEAENAVHAGLDLVARVSQLLLPSGEPLATRVGIATGVVIVEETIGGGSTREQSAVGETLNLAARLQALAEPNSVVIADATRRLLGGGFVCEQLGDYELKGFSEPVSAFKVTGERAVESRFDARRATKLTHFVGRQRELRQLSHLWAMAKEGKGQIAFLCGEPGIGKSRTTIALLEEIAGDAHITIRWQCSSHHTHSPFFPAIRHLERAARFEPDDTSELKLEKLERALSRAGQAILTDSPLYAALLSIPNSGRYPTLELTPQRQKELTISALIRQLLSFAASQPLLFILEDAHWIDATTMELIDRTIESITTAPVLAVITFRPDFFPPCLDQPHVTTLRLERLGRDQVGNMITDISGFKKLPSEVSELIVSKTDGVPLFVEEMTKAILESGLLKDTGDRYIMTAPLSAPAIPATLHDSLMARLDRLAPIKEIAQIGAAIGREFSYRLLAAVSGMSSTALNAALAQLAAAELIFGRGEPPDSNYTFKHALVQDVAYASLLRGKRQQLHRAIAEALKAYFVDTVETQPELMAHHLEQAGLTEQAIDYLRRAGQRAIERSAITEAIRHLRRALELLELIGGGARPKPALELEVMLAQAMIAGRGYAANETREALLRAKTLIGESTTPSQKFAVLYGIWASYYVGGNVAMQRHAAAEFLAEAERHGACSTLSLAHRVLGTTYVSMGEFEPARQHLEQARVLYDPEDHPDFLYEYGQDIGVAALCYLCWALWHLGYVEQASKVAIEAVARAKALSHPHTLAYTICHAQGMMDIFRRSPADARTYAGQVVSLCTEHAFPFWAAGGKILDGWAATCLGEVDQGIELLRSGLDAWRETGALLWLPIFLALEAEAHAKAGRSDAAVHVIERAITTSKETGECWAIAEILRVKASILSTLGRSAAKKTESVLRESVEIARRQHARCFELRSACDLARLWKRQGREEKALKLLQSIYNQFTEGFDTADLLEAKALLESLSPDSILKGSARVLKPRTSNRHRRPPSGRKKVK
jgi:class 3 adenylate cyclase/predicted ATPase